MGLSGTFSDLSLGEVLQIAMLSGNTGVLRVHSPHGRAWLGFDGGEVTRVARDGAPLSRDRVLKESGIADDDAAAAAECLRDAATEAILDLFEWDRGDFSLDAFSDPNETWDGPEGLFIDPPLSAAALALEAARVRDESALEPEARDDETLVETDQLRVPAEAREDAEPLLDDDAIELIELPAEDEEDGPDGAPELRPPSVVIVIGRNLSSLEEIKGALVHGGVRVHLLQLPGEVLRRVQQYLLNGQYPLVLIDATPGERPDPPSTDPWWRDLADRIRTMTSRVRVVALAHEAAPPRAFADATIQRPRTLGSDAAMRQMFLESLAEAIASEIRGETED